MDNNYFMEFVLVDPSLYKNSSSSGAPYIDPETIFFPGDKDACSANEYENIINERRAKIEGLIPIFTLVTFPYSTVDEFIETGMPEEIARRRHARMSALEGKWEDLYIEIHLLDLATKVFIQFGDISKRGQKEKLHSSLSRLLKILMDITAQETVVEDDFISTNPDKSAAYLIQKAWPTIKKEGVQNSVSLA